MMMGFGLTEIFGMMRRRQFVILLSLLAGCATLVTEPFWILAAGTWDDRGRWVDRFYWKDQS